MTGDKQSAAVESIKTTPLTTVCHQKLSSSLKRTIFCCFKESSIRFDKAKPTDLREVFDSVSKPTTDLRNLSFSKHQRNCYTSAWSQDKDKRANLKVCRWWWRYNTKVYVLTIKNILTCSSYNSMNECCFSTGDISWRWSTWETDTIKAGDPLLAGNFHDFW